ncbi:hypothetical protein TruAng_009976 [Truncatella angustata]|nr:hypothetical protein TruAng_009976 [Truncatella angustata]
MAGALHLEAPNGAAPLSGVHARIFQSSASPSISNSVYMGKSSGSLYSDVSMPASNIKRKRYDLRDSPPSSGYARTETGNVKGVRQEIGRRTSGGRDIRYTYGGSVGTPNGVEPRQSGYMDDSTYSDIDYRRALGSKRPQEDEDVPTAQSPVMHPAAGWGWFGLGTIGGVVGKVWEFCRGAGFAGFHAGGGRGYGMSLPPVQGQIWCNEHDIPTLPGLPGGFPESECSPFRDESEPLEFTPVQYEREAPESSRPPGAKRRQTSYGMSNDELQRNWVMVKEDASTKIQPVSSSSPPKVSQQRPPLNRRISKPVSRISNPSVAQGTSNSVSHAGSSTLTNRQPASFASPRSVVVPERPATPSRLPVLSRPRSSSTVSHRLSQSQSLIASPVPSSARGHRRSQSTASAVSFTPPSRLKKRESSAREIVEGASPRLDTKARNMVVKRMKQQQETDARINDLNTRLVDMIRQGKEALGTTVEVDGFEDQDGGHDPWEDD